MIEIRCDRRRPEHEIVGAGLLLRGLRSNEPRMYAAAGADPEARHWLGFQKVPSPAQIQLDLTSPGGGRWLRSVNNPPDGGLCFTVIQQDGAVAGFLTLRRPARPWRARIAAAMDLVPPATPDWQLGIIMVPKYRGQRIGQRAIGLLADFAHRHLGHVGITAGCEPANTASHRALLAAGFRPTDGPAQQVLVDGRVIDSLWFRHTAPEPPRPEDRCRLVPAPPRARYRAPVARQDS